MGSLGPGKALGLLGERSKLSEGSPHPRTSDRTVVATSAQHRQEGWGVGSGGGRDGGGRGREGGRGGGEGICSGLWMRR